MPRWSAPSVTATSLVIAAAVSHSGLAAADPADPVERLLAVAALYSPAADGLSVEVVRRSCGEDRLCAARHLAAAAGEGVRLERVRHPDSDTIRWVKTAPSVTEVRRLSDGTSLIVLDRFGRTAEREVRAALDALRAETGGSANLVLDLRNNRGGDLERMLKVAALFMSDTENAVYLHDMQRSSGIDIDSGTNDSIGPGTVLVGSQTASSGEILAALLRRHAGAALLGERTAGKDLLYRVIPVDHDWRLLLPAERVEIPGETLAGGLRPDGAIPVALAEELER